MAEITNYKVASSPHVADGASVRRIMLDVLIALLPCVVCGVLFFGLYSLMLVVICVAACFASEQVYNLIRKKPITTDLSAVVTGVILGLNLPPRAPWGFLPPLLAPGLTPDLPPGLPPERTGGPERVVLADAAWPGPDVGRLGLRGCRPDCREVAPAVPSPDLTV